MDQDDRERYLFRDILKQVSRSFYLTLAVLPAPVSRQVGLAYLFARAADTIADTGQVDRRARMFCLKQLKAQFVRDEIGYDEIRAIQTMMAPLQHHDGERVLLEQLEACFEILETLSREDQRAIRKLLPTLIGGMEMDLTVFPGDHVSTLTALPTMAELDQYVYAVAGCVGEFWTEMMCQHLPRMREWDRESKVRLGIRFGKGLQLTNILKDLPRDLRRGRCYIPFSELERVGLQPQDLLDRHNLKKLTPVVQRLLGIALAHLDQGWFYTMAIPRLEFRLRLACMWPILIGLRTLHVLTTEENILDPLAQHKISRWQVYRIVLLTSLTGASGQVGSSYWNHIRKAVG